MKTVELDSAPAQIVEYAHEADEQPVVFTIEGQPYAALLPIEEESVRTMLKLYADKVAQEEHEFEVEIRSLDNNPRFNELIEQALQSIERGETTSHAEVMREFSLD